MLKIFAQTFGAPQTGTSLKDCLRNPVLPAFLGDCNSTDPSGTSQTGRFISSLASLALIGAALVTFIFLLLGGIAWVTSEGDKAKLEQARNRILHAIIGLIVVASAWAIWILLGQFLGIDFRHIPVPTLNQVGS